MEISVKYKKDDELIFEGKGIEALKKIDNLLK
jgi:hypothetical protein